MRCREASAESRFFSLLLLEAEPPTLTAARASSRRARFIWLTSSTLLKSVPRLFDARAAALLARAMVLRNESRVWVESGSWRAEVGVVRSCSGLCTQAMACGANLTLRAASTVHANSTEQRQSAVSVPLYRSDSMDVHKNLDLHSLCGGISCEKTHFVKYFANCLDVMLADHFQHAK